MKVYRVNINEMIKILSKIGKDGHSHVILDIKEEDDSYVLSIHPMIEKESKEEKDDSVPDFDPDLIS